MRVDLEKRTSLVIIVRSEFSPRLRSGLVLVEQMGSTD
jgi:hypothetical protein